MEVKRLTKAEILAGRDFIHYERVKELGGEIGFRPLTDGQYAQVEAIRAQGTTLRGKPSFDQKGDIDYQDAMGNMEMVIDAAKTTELDVQADATAVAYSLSGGGETWTVDEILGLSPPGLVKILAGIVYKISKVNEVKVQEIKNFRNK